jgi:hypothetical protein
MIFPNALNQLGGGRRFPHRRPASVWKPTPTVLLTVFALMERAADRQLANMEAKTGGERAA